MNIRKTIEKTFESKKIKYFKGNGENDNVFNLPYRGIIVESNHINIYMEVIEELGIIKFTLIEKANMKIDINELKARLLDINSKLNFGTLSMRNESDTIEYKVDYQLCDSEFSYEQYNKFVARCITMYEELKKLELIV